MPVTTFYAQTTFEDTGILPPDLTTLQVGRQQVDNLTISMDTQTSFTLSASPISASSVSLFLNGVRQDYSVDYSVSGTTLTWSSGISLITSDVLIAVYEKAVSGG